MIRRVRLLRLSAAVLLGSMGAGLVSPVLAAGDALTRLTSDGLDEATLEAALHAAVTSNSAEQVAAAVTTALGEQAPTPDAFLHALYGHLYQLLQLQQGPRAVTVSSMAGSAGDYSPNLVAISQVSRSVMEVGRDLCQSPDAVLAPTPRAQNPAVQPLGP